MNTFNIAIDGPAGAGKSTVARLTANRLHFQYIDTGAMYRAVTWLALQRQLPLDDSERMAAAAMEMDLVLETTPEGTRVYVGGVEITEDIRTPQVTSHVSAVAKIAAVRDILVKKQQQMAARGGVVMDGRDIGTKVLPHAEVKVFLTASIEERARRRFAEMQAKGIDTSLSELTKDIARRDELDSQRVVSPLKKANDATVLDTTGLDVAEVVEKILALCRTKVARP
ncbi:(d)CMP kinase [Numidum massiliense]|uniref:(d)CMP kinase n=1 Tax=Numidum massiliense TaxID=1522315 RepID=UPI0006D57DD7|nr:(d)CMP kinase [Numidum massiliense]